MPDTNIFAFFKVPMEPIFMVSIFHRIIHTTIFVTSNVKLIFNKVFNKILNIINYRENSS